MNRFVHEIALMATLIVVGASLWQDWGTLTTLKRMLVAYLCFFGLGAGLGLALRAASRPRPPRAESDPRTQTQAPPRASGTR